MHTIMLICGGFLLLGLFVEASRWWQSSTASAALRFLPVWLIASIINMVVGVERAGYTYAEEFPIFLAVFGIPALAALALRYFAR